MVSGWPAITDICCVYLPVEAGANVYWFHPEQHAGCRTRAGMVSGWPAITDICCVYLPVEAGAV